MNSCRQNETLKLCLIPPYLSHFRVMRSSMRCVVVSTTYSIFLLFMSTDWEERRIQILNAWSTNSITRPVAGILMGMEVFTTSLAFHISLSDQDIANWPRDVWWTTFITVLYKDWRGLIWARTTKGPSINLSSPCPPTRGSLCSDIWSGSKLSHGSNLRSSVLWPELAKITFQYLVLGNVETCTDMSSYSKLAEISYDFLFEAPVCSSGKSIQEAGEL